MAAKRLKPVGGARVTGADVARLAKVDPAVVSKLLKGDPKLRVSEETRQRVMDAVDQLGYRPNYAAQRLRSSRQIGAVGLIIPNFSNPAFAEIVHGAEVASRKQKISLFVASDDEFTTPLELITDLVASERVDAILIAGGTAKETAAINEFLTKRRFPFLFLNRQSVGTRRSLFLDDEYAIELAVNHLVKLGHTRIYNIAGKKTMETGKRRQKAFMEAIKSAGLPFTPDLIVEEEYSALGGQHGFEKIMARKPKPTALLVSEFVMAVGAMNAARKAKVSIPDQLSLVAFNNLDIASLLNPTLTTVGLQLQHLGEEGFNLLLETPFDEEIYQTVSKSAQLYPRESTRAIRK
ncbi:MAG: LacI family DNA-binding transcriptional regulator [Actinobacteria bacterium]|nr:LacI family DNA-binding transcriptional regulator [Actinomycetota bacterium]